MPRETMEICATLRCTCKQPLKTQNYATISKLASQGKEIRENN